MHFLRAVFGVSEDHRMFQADVMRWKCFAPHPFWEGGRGYALRYKGEIAAFGCVVPCRFLTGSETVGSCNVIDWAASKAVPGAGILLYRHIKSLAGTMINIGGTDEARQVLPKIGFDVRVERHCYRRVVRPWRLFRTESPRDWKSPLRLARDYAELGRPSPTVGRRLAARRVDGFHDIKEELFPDPSVAARVVCARNAESLDYFLACPAAKTQGYLLERDGQPAGYFLLSSVRGQRRIADLWIRSADQPDWAEAYHVAAAMAEADSETTDVTVAASSATLIEALKEAGYHRTHSEPVFVLDPGVLLRERSDLTIGLLENDSFYWRSGSG
jgi:hypothetical protein